jgi:hypothetical protein
MSPTARRVIGKVMANIATPRAASQKPRAGALPEKIAWDVMASV